MPENRLANNRLILSLLSEAVEKNPDLRFHQLLQNLRVEIPGTDQFYEESSKTLKNLSEAKMWQAQC